MDNTNNNQLRIMGHAESPSGTTPFLLMATALAEDLNRKKIVSVQNCNLVIANL
jgi:hypothetical protein